MMGKESYPKLIPGAFLFDPVTGYIVQVVCYHRDSTEGNKLVITRPSRSLAEASIQDWECDQDNLSRSDWASQELLIHVRNHSLLILEEQKTINSFLGTAILVNKEAQPKHKFIRPDSFYDNYVVDENWANKHGVSLTKTWRAFTQEWGGRDVGGINYKGFIKSPLITSIVNGVKEIIFKGLPRLYSVKRLRDDD